MARAQTAWRCSQCGTVNEAGARSCGNCGKWASLFDLQESVEEVAVAGDEVFGGEVLEPELFEPGTFETETYEPETIDPAVYGTGVPESADDEEEGRKSRFPRWAITAIWVIGVIIWLVANALGDRG